MVHIHLCTEPYEQGTLTFPKDHTSYLGINNVHHSDGRTAFLPLYHSIPEEKEKTKAINQMIEPLNAGELALHSNLFGIFETYSYNYIVY